MADCLTRCVSSRTVKWLKCCYAWRGAALAWALAMELDTAKTLDHTLVHPEQAQVAAQQALEAGFAPVQKGLTEVLAALATEDPTQAQIWRKSSVAPLARRLSS